MNIGIDIDGCLMDFTNFTWNGMPLFSKRHNIEYNPIDFPTYSFEEQFKITSELSEDFWLEEECKNMYLNLPPRPYTREVLEYFKNQGHKLFIITARSNSIKNKNLIERTMKWLNENNLFFDGIYFNTGDKIDIINKLNIDFMLEDSPSNIIKISKNANCKIFCFDTFCNREIMEDINIIRVYSMLDFKEKLDREIKTPRQRKKVLLVVDLQQEFKDKEGNYDKILEFIKNNSKNYDEVIATRFINGNDNFKKYLNYNFPNEILPLEFNPNIIINKKGYGLDDYNKLPKYYDYDIIGCDSDACILKIAYDLFDKEYNFNILKDYIYSNGHIYNETLKIIERNLRCLK